LSTNAQQPRRAAARDTRQLHAHAKLRLEGVAEPTAAPPRKHAYDDNGYKMVGQISR
jgi:hypothetical protein